MKPNLIAKSSIVINALGDKVWNALINPEIISKYTPGVSVNSDWQIGSPIIWKGIEDGKPYEDKGKVLNVVPRKLLQYSRYNSLSNLGDIPENYHTVSIELGVEGYRTQIWLSQDKNINLEEQIKTQTLWNGILQNLKKVLEKKSWEQ